MLDLTVLLGARLGWFFAKRTIKNKKESQAIVSEIVDLYKKRKQALDVQIDETNRVLEELARTKVRVSAIEIKTFSTVYEKFKNWPNREDRYTKIKGRSFEHEHFISPSHTKVEAAEAADVLKNGIKLTQGEMTAIAARGGVSAIRIAYSLGKPTSSHESGATPFGAISFDPSGLNGGISDVTLTAIGKLVLKLKTGKILANTTELRAAVEGVEKMQEFYGNLANICQIANDYEKVILKLSRELNAVISCMNSIFNRYSGGSANGIFDRYSTYRVSQVDFSNLDREERESLNNALNVAQTLQRLLNQRLVNDYCQVDAASKELLYKVRSDYGI